MPYVGQISGEPFTKRFNVIPDDFNHEQNEFDWSYYYYIYGHGDIIKYPKNGGIIIPSNYYIGEGYEIMADMDFAVYVLDKLPTGNDYLDVIGNARYIQYPITLEKRNIIVWETDFGEFEKTSDPITIENY